MTFTNTTFKHTNTTPDEKLQDLIIDKFSSLDKFIQNETDVRLEVELEKMPTGHTGPVYRMETNFWLAGKLYRSENNQDSFEKAIDHVRNEIEKEVRRDHKKQNSLFRRGRRKIKEMLLGGR